MLVAVGKQEGIEETTAVKVAMDGAAWTWS